MTQPLQVEHLEARRFFAAGDFDTSFSGNGVAIATFGDFQEPHDLAVQLDGKTLVVGSGRVAREGTHSVDFALARFRDDGSLDSTFGTGGKVLTDFGSSEDVAYALAIQPDGKIVVAGKANLPRGDGKFGGGIGVARYLPEGSLDPSFGGGDGLVTVQVGPLSYARSIILQPDGKIVLAGSAHADTRVSDSAFALARLDAEGRLDAGFSNARSPAGTPAGVVISDWTIGYDHAYDLALDARGRIVVSGETGASPEHFLTLARYLPDGALDRSFDGDGVLLTHTPGSGGQAVGIQSDGRILAAGQNFKLLRFREDGTLDRRAGDRGIHNVAGTIPGGWCSDLLIQSDDKVLLVGQSTGKFTISRRLAHDLGPDRSFATTDPNRPGQVSVDLDPDAPSDTAVAVGMAPDGAIVVAASRWTQAFVVARLENTVLPKVEVMAEQPSAVETSAAAATFRFTHAGPTDAPLRVNFRVGGSAENGLDYQAIFSSVTIPAGSNTAILSIVPMNDRIWEPTEFVTLALLGGAYSPSSEEAVVSIDDDDNRPIGASISGRVFEDANHDGIRSRGEIDLPRWRVFVDSNNDGRFGFDEPHAFTDAYGFYTIRGIEAGVHTVRADAAHGWRRTRPLRGAHVVESNGATEVLGKHFGYTQDVYVTGMVFHDLNADARLSAGEPPIVGELVYVDYNDNGQFDTNEPSTRTGDDGTFVFAHLPTGWLPLRTGRSGPVKQTLPLIHAGYDISSTYGGTVHPERDFGYVFTARILGSVFADQDGDGVSSTGDYNLDGFRVFLDRNGDGHFSGREPYAHTDAAGQYVFTDIPVGEYWLRVSSGKGWRVTTGEGYVVTVDAGGSILRHFGVTRNVLILGNVFMDANVDGGKDEAEDGLSEWTVFVDADRDGVLDPDEISVRTDAAGRYAIRTLAGGTHRIRVVESSNYRRTAPAAGFREVSLMPGEILTKANFGQKRILAR
ncbi:MAG TPA: hypothetical protein VGR35_08380 [Tepidisphaeraceae bacterium]|nr:hypothetical protein [Tepidisphaeraceae bacterium]